MKTFLGLIVLGWAAILAALGVMYLIYLAAGSWERLGMWAVYLLVVVMSSGIALIVGANIWYTQFMNVSKPSNYRRFQPWLDKRAKKAQAKAAALKQDGQLSEAAQVGVGQVSLTGKSVGGCSLNPGHPCTHPKHMD